MKKNIIIPLVLMCLMSFPSWGVTKDDLVRRNGLYYQKFTDVPFTGEVEGKWKGSIKNGLKEGTWVTYYDNGQLWGKGDYKNGDEEGTWVEYWKNGQLFSKGNYTNGKREGTWVYYWGNGQLWKKGDYKNGEREGTWVWYHRDGSKKTSWSGVYRNDKKVSD